MGIGSTMRRLLGIGQSGKQGMTAGGDFAAEKQQSSLELDRIVLAN